MPRQARLDSPGTLHHVMVRGIEGRDIFFDDSDREDFLSGVRELSLDTRTRILAWTLMSNHLLLFSGKTGLAAFMRKLLTLNWEMGVSMAEIARYLGVGASAIAMAIRKEERAK